MRYPRPEIASSASITRRVLAAKVAHAHSRLGDASMMALVSGSVVEDIADDQSDIDMSIVFGQLPSEAALRAACVAVGDAPWHWQMGSLAEGSQVVAFKFEGVEVQIAYSDHATMQRDVDQVLVGHDPDTPLHKLAEGLLKAEPLAGAERLAALQARLAQFPPELGRAMAAHYLGRITPWRAITQLLARDATLWCRELQAQAAYRLIGALAGLNGLYFTTFQFKRMQRFVARMAQQPRGLAERLESVFSASATEAFGELHALEGEVIELVAARWPEIDLATVRQRRQGYAPARAVSACA